MQRQNFTLGAVNLEKLATTNSAFSVKNKHCFVKDCITFLKM